MSLLMLYANFVQSSTLSNVSLKSVEFYIVKKAESFNAKMNL